MRIFIYGSCVSRDILASDHTAELELVNYFARSSLISLSSSPQVVPREVESISSEFQRRMVVQDFDKSFFKEVVKNDFDILLMDFIDERFDILSIGNGFVTISNEFVSSGYFNSHGSAGILKRSDDHMFELWEEAWKLYVERISSIGILHKVRINKVYWSSQVLQEGVSLKGVAGFSEINARLDRMYDRASKDLKSHQIYTYDDSTLIADQNHKWGLSPYHYVEEFYVSGVDKLIEDSVSKLSSCLDVMFLNFSVERLRQEPADDEFYDLLDRLGLQKIKNIAVSSNSNNYIDKVLSEFLVSGDLAGFVSSGSCSDGILFSLLVGNYNFLVLMESGVLVAIVQHHKFMRGVYLLDRNEFYYYTSYNLSPSLFCEFWAEMDRKKECIINSFGGEVGFGSIFSYPRPYHFFYDTLPRFYRFREMFSEDYALFSVDDGSFFPLDINRRSYNFSTYMELNDYCISKSIVNVNLGYGNRDLNESIRYDKNIKELSRSLATTELINTLDSARSRGCFVIWVGICSEKRAWIEQVDALRLLNEKLLQTGFKPFYLFDGITKTIYGGKSVTGLIADEEKIVRRFLDSISGFDGYCSLIGAAAYDKVASSQYIDFFISSFLTDSMYPARFSKAIGLGFGAKKAVHYEHLHPRTYFIPDELVIDIGEGNWATLSCSINPEYVSSILLSIINGIDRNFIPVKCLGIRKDRSNIDFSLQDEGNLISWDLDSKQYVRLNEKFHGFCEVTQGSYLLAGDKDFLINFSMGNFRAPGFTLHGIVVKDGSRVESFSLYSGSSYIIKRCKHDRFLNLFFRLSGIGSVRDVVISVVPIDNADNQCSELSPVLDKKTVIDLSFDSLVLSEISGRGAFDFNVSSSHGRIAFRFLNRLSDKLVVFFNAAVSRIKGIVPPFFSGSGVASSLDCSVLMVSDPSLDLNENLSLGWYIGNEDWNVSKDIAEIIKAFKEHFGYKKTVLYGGAGGGFAVLKLAEQLDDVSVIAANPQTRIFSYDEGSVRRYMDVFSFSRDSRSIGEEVGGGLSRFETEPVLINESNTVLYLQNSYDYHHVDKHLSFFLDSLGVSVKMISLDTVKSIGVNKYLLLSTKWGRGHRAPPKDFIVNLLSKHLYCPLADLDSDINDLNIETGSLIDEVVLKLDGNKLIVNTKLSSSAHDGELLNALYIYCDGVKVGQLGYSKDFYKVFELNGYGVIRVSSFVKGGGQSEVVKSRKVRYEQ